MAPASAVGAGAVKPAQGASECRLLRSQGYPDEVAWEGR